MAGKEYFVAMDYVRYLMALGVVVAHFNMAMGCDIWWPVSSSTAVSVFFGLSGFLVCGTYLRKRSLIQYIRGRAKRIMPIYSAIVLLSAMLLCFASTLNVTDYFSHPDFWKYIVANMCFMNFVQPTLPGVFCDNIETCVNGSLWTLKVEWALYFSIPLFYWIQRRLKISIINLILTTFMLSVIYKTFMQYLHGMTGLDIFHILSYQFMGQLTFFYTGVLIFHNLEFCKRQKVVLLILSASMCLVCMHVAETYQHWAVSMLYDLLFPIAIVTFFLLISCIDWHGICLPRIPNLSYELYLIHFPVIQVVAQEFRFPSNALYLVLVAELTVIILAAYILKRALIL